MCWSIELGMGVVSVWLGMFFDWAVRGALVLLAHDQRALAVKYRGPTAGRPVTSARGATNGLGIKASSR